MKSGRDNKESKIQPLLSALVVVVVIVLAAVVFAVRYQPAFTDANFYAEDGKVFVDTVLRKPPLQTLLTGFNGYLVAGQYILTELSVDAATALGLHFYQLPKMLALVSCLFLGLTVSLPYILFRKELGTVLALFTVLFGALTPMPGSDYAIIGTIGNLKFAFLFWAFIFVLFRIKHANSTKLHLFVIDLVLLLSVLTYAPAIALLPLAFWPYRKHITQAYRSKSWRLLKEPQFVSLLVLCIIGAIYVFVVLLKGVPPLPGYLDAPYDPNATIKIAFHSTWYAWLYLITENMRDGVTLSLLGVVSYLGLRHKNNQEVFLIGMWAIAIGTISFVANRTGIGDFFLQYSKGPDQFFYAQRLVFLFVTVWMFAAYYRELSSESKIIYVVLMSTLVLLLFKQSGSFGANKVLYQDVGNAQVVVEKACTEDQSSKNVRIDLYPSKTWQWVVPRKIACD